MQSAIFPREIPGEIFAWIFSWLKSGPRSRFDLWTPFFVKSFIAFFSWLNNFGLALRNFLFELLWNLGEFCEKICFCSLAQNCPWNSRGRRRTVSYWLLVQSHPWTFVGVIWKKVISSVNNVLCGSICKRCHALFDKCSFAIWIETKVSD